MNVLIIDNETASQVILKRLIQKVIPDVLIRMVYSHQEAITLLAVEAFDYIFLDLMLNHQTLNDLEEAITFIQTYPTQKIIVCSACDGTNIKTKLKQAGAYEYIDKCTLNGYAIARFFEVQTDFLDDE